MKKLITFVLFASFIFAATMPSSSAWPIGEKVYLENYEVANFPICAAAFAHATVRPAANPANPSDFDVEAFTNVQTTFTDGVGCYDDSDDVVQSWLHDFFPMATKTTAVITKGWTVCQPATNKFTQTSDGAWDHWEARFPIVASNFCGSGTYLVWNFSETYWNGQWHSGLDISQPQLITIP